MVRRGRSIWLSLHKIIGLSLGLWVVLNGLSGSILVYQLEIEAALSPDLYFVPSVPATVSYNAMFATVAEAYPDRSVMLVTRDARANNESYRFILTSPKATLPYDEDLEVFVDPNTNEIIGARNWLTVVKAIRLFHTELLGGRIGEVVMGVLTLLLIIAMIAGTVLWWPKNGKFGRALQMKRSSPMPRLIRDLHNVSGMYFLIVFAVLCGTGLVIVFPAQTEALVKPFAEIRPPLRIFSVSQGDMPLPPDAIVKAVLDAYPGGTINRYQPAPSSEFAVALLVLPHDKDPTLYTTVVFMDQFTGEFIDRFDPAAQPAANSFITLWSIYLHDGKLLGPIGRMLVFAAGFAFLSLFVTRLFVWLKRRGSLRA